MRGPGRQPLVIALVFNYLLHHTISQNETIRHLPRSHVLPHLDCSVHYLLLLHRGVVVLLQQFAVLLAHGWEYG